MTKKIWSYIIGILCIISGIYFIINPVSSFSDIIYIIGMIFLVLGVLELVVIIINKEDNKIRIYKSVINIIFGIILTKNPATTIKIISTFIGIWLILKSAGDLCLILSVKNNQISHVKLIESIAKLILGIIIITTPIITFIFTGTILGAILIAIGVITILKTLGQKKTYKVKVKK